jgi:hypothetical protein
MPPRNPGAAARILSYHEVESAEEVVHGIRQLATPVAGIAADPFHRYAGSAFGVSSATGGLDAGNIIGQSAQSWGCWLVNS